MNKGFIFTLDAVLAMIPIFIVLASVASIGGIDTINSYRMLSSGRYAQDVLTILEYNGVLVNVSRTYQTGVARSDTALILYSMNLLNSSLNTTIPTYLGYNATIISPRGTFSVSRGDESQEENIMSVWRSSVGPERGWAGTAWYTIEESTFTDVNRTTVSTLWNFHNWLSNFGNQEGYSNWRPTEWGPNNLAINFSVPTDATINDAYFIIGAGEIDYWNGPYRPWVYFNGAFYSEVDTFTWLSDSGSIRLWNNITSIDPSIITSGINNFWIDFTNCYANYIYYDNLPWFSMIVNYTSPVPTPDNLFVETFNLPNAEGYWNSSYPSIQWADNDATWASRVDAVDDGTPFRITEGGGFSYYSGADYGSAISVVGNFTVPSGMTIVDANLNLNLYGAVDATRVEMFDNNASQWTTIFNSFDINGIDYSDVTSPPGFGNLPGKIDINSSYIRPDVTNYVRVTFWDYAPGGGDYDFVGIIDSTITVSYTSAILRWDNYPFDSHQDGDSDYSDTRIFEVGSGAHEALLFTSVGLDSRRLQVDIKDTTSGWTQLYDSDIIPYMLNLAQLDASLGSHIITTDSSNATEYTLIPGEYTVRVSVTGPTYGWESGDKNKNAEIFSGTKVTILYPEFIELLTAETYNETATEADESARKTLSEQLLTYDLIVPWNSTEIISQAVWVSGVPAPTFADLKIWYEGG